MKKVCLMFALAVMFILLFPACSNDKNTDPAQIEDEKSIDPAQIEDEKNIDSAQIEDENQDMEQIKVVLNEKISPEMPEFEFTITGIESQDFCHASELEIINQEISFSQKLTFEETTIFTKYKDTLGLRIADINFDGYSDLILLYECTNAKANHFYYAWLWNEDSKEFVQQPAFQEIYNPAIDQDGKVILSVFAKTAAIGVWQMYSYENEGGFLLNNELTIEFIPGDAFVPEQRHYIETIRENNEMKVISDEYGVAQDSENEIADYYNSADSIWNLSSNKWYNSDYGNEIGINE